MRTVSMFSLLLCLAISGVALAQEEPKKEESTEKKGSIQGNRIDLGEIRVTGQARGPAAFYVLQTPTLSYPEVKLKKSFLGKVVESAEKTSAFAKK